MVQICLFVHAYTQRPFYKTYGHIGAYDDSSFAHTMSSLFHFSSRVYFLVQPIGSALHATSPISARLRSGNS